jgi:hypothetical protein
MWARRIGRRLARPAGLLLMYSHSTLLIDDGPTLRRRSQAQLAAGLTAAWSTVGPHAIGPERFATVSSGTSLAQVAGAILGKQTEVENPEKHEVPGSSLGSPANHFRSSRPPGRSSALVLPARRPGLCHPRAGVREPQLCDDPCAGLSPRPDGDARNAGEQGRPQWGKGSLWTSSV